MQIENISTNIVGNQKSFMTRVILLSYFANFTAASFFLCLVENKILFTKWNNKLKTKE